MRWAWLALCVPGIATAQGGSCNSGVPLLVGEIKVAFSTVVKIATAPAGPWTTSQVCGGAVADGDSIHRVLFDRQSHPYFGYDLQIHSNLAARTVRIEVTVPTGRISLPDMTPGQRRPRIEIEGATLRTFQKLPEPVILADGDRVSVPVMRNPRTGEIVILDSFEVGLPGTAVQTRPVGGIPKDPPAGTLLHLEEPSLTTSFSDFGSSPEMGVTGPIVWIYTPRLGRILFSAAPRPGYFRKAIAEGAVIRFEDGVESYSLQLRAAAVPGDGPWQLWCKREPAYRPPPGPWGDEELRHGLLAIGMERGAGH